MTACENALTAVMVSLLVLGLIEAAIAIVGGGRE